MWNGHEESSRWTCPPAITSAGRMAQGHWRGFVSAGAAAPKQAALTFARATARQFSGQGQILPPR